MQFWTVVCFYFVFLLLLFFVLFFSFPFVCSLPLMLQTAKRHSKNTPFYMSVSWVCQLFKQLESMKAICLYSIQATWHIWLFFSVMIITASLSVVCVTHNWPVVSSCLCWHCCCLGEAPDVFATVIKLSWSYASAASSCRKGLDVFSSCRRTSRPISFAQEVCDNKRPGYSLSI